MRLQAHVKRLLAPGGVAWRQSVQASTMADNSPGWWRSGIPRPGCPNNLGHTRRKRGFDFSV